jgi:predicted metalloendopeptidase
MRIKTKKGKRSCKNTTKKLFHKKEKCTSELGLKPFELNFSKKMNLKQSKNYQKELIKAFHIPFAPRHVTPRSDYYTYINNIWIEQTSKAEKKDKYYTQIDDFRLTQDKVYKQLIDIVKQYVKQNKCIQAKLINNVYKSLLNLNHYTSVKHYKELHDRINYFMQKDVMYELLGAINKNEILSWGCPLNWSIGPDPKQSTVFINRIYAPQFSLYDLNLYLDDYDQTPDFIQYKNKIKRDYIQYIDTMFDKCFGLNHGLKGTDVYEVEYDILMANGCDSVKNDSMDYNKVSKEDSLKKYGFDWEKFSHFIGYKKTPDFFLCGSLNYLKCITELMLKNWKTPKWKSYWIYIGVRQIIRFDSKLRYLYYDFQEKKIRGQEDPFPKELYPVFGLSLTFNTFLTNAYIDKYQDKRYLEYTRVLGQDLLLVFKRIISRNTWLSPVTKKHALEKLNNFNFIIGNPRKLREDPLLDYTDDDAWDNMAKLCFWKTQKYIELSGKEVIDIPMIDWNTFKLIGKQAYIVNAFYTPLENSIYIPTAYLQPPFVDLEERGIEYNLARLGYVIGHEMSHSLDNMGSKYDFKGNLNDWWTPRDKQRYQVIIKDIIKQYEVFALYDGIKFDAALSVGEDMADISGLAICNEYLRDFQIKNEDIIPIKQLSFEAFYTYFAVQQRQHVSEKAIAAQLKTNPHPLDKYRTNVPLSRLELFRNLYNVKKGDKMWWHSTSTVW